MYGRQKFVTVAEMIFTELTSGISKGFQRLSNGDVARLKSDERAGNSYLGQASALRRLPGNERRAASGAAIFRVVVREHHSFLGDAVDVRRLVADHAKGIGADVGLADIVTHYDEEVRFLSTRCRLRLLRLRGLGRQARADR